MRNGILIAIDGIDGAGKTTQVKMLADRLTAAGATVTASKEPTDGVWGRKLRQSATTGRMPLKEELHAFVEDRKEHVANLILPALSRREIVILDRYYFSTIAYQGARGADMEEIASQMTSIAPTPDVTILIDVDPSVSISRISNSRGDIPNEFEKADYLRIVRENFRNIARKSQGISFIDGSLPVEMVYRTIVELLLNSNAFKSATCGKSYGCDQLYCTLRMTGECQWSEFHSRLLNGNGRSTVPALIANP